MARYKNKRLMVRGRGGRFRKTSPRDFGIGDMCPTCNGLTIRYYDGDPRDPHPHPLEFRYRCFTCEPRTEQEKVLEAETEASKPKEKTLFECLEEIAKEYEEREAQP